MIHAEKPDADRRLREVLDELSTACSRYVSVSHQVKGRGATAPMAGRTRLDMERLKLCQREIVSFLSAIIIYKSSNYSVHDIQSFLDLIGIT
jgi:hypothetical protein